MLEWLRSQRAKKSPLAKLEEEEWKEIEPGKWWQRQRMIQTAVWIILLFVFFKGCASIVFKPIEEEAKDFVAMTTPVLESDAAKAMALAYVHELITWDGSDKGAIDSRKQRLERFNSFSATSEAVNLIQAKGKSRVTAAFVQDVRHQPMGKQGDERAHIIVTVRRQFEVPPNAGAQRENSAVRGLVGSTDKAAAEHVREAALQDGLEILYVGVPLSHLEGRFGLYEPPFIAVVPTDRPVVEGFTMTGTEAAAGEREKVSELAKNFFRRLGTGSQMEIDYYMTPELAGTARGFQGQFSSNVDQIKVYQVPNGSGRLLVYAVVSYSHPDGSMFTNRYTMLLVQMQGRYLIGKMAHGFEGVETFLKETVQQIPLTKESREMESSVSPGSPKQDSEKR